MSPIILLLLLTWMQNPHPKRKAKLAQDPKTHMLRLRFANMVSTTCPFKDSWTGGIATSTPTFSEQVPILRLPAPLCGPCLCHPPSHLGFHLEKNPEVSLRKQASKHQIVGRWRGRHLCTLRHPTDLSWCSKPIRHRGSIRWFRFLESSFSLDHTYVILRQHAARLWTASLWELQQLDTSKYEPTEILSWVSVYRSLHISQNSVFTVYNVHLYLRLKMSPLSCSNCFTILDSATWALWNGTTEETSAGLSLWILRPLS